jgi:putative membrane protein
MLNPQDHQRIADAVSAAEAKTSGEIMCVVADTVSDYQDVPIGWAVAAALLVPPVLLAAGLPLESVAAAAMRWASGSVLTAWLIAYVTAQAVVFGIVRWIVGLPAVRRRLTGRAAVRARVRRAAHSHFVGALTLVKADQPAVLIFASEGDRQLEILANPVIDAAVRPGAWAAVADRAVQTVRDKGLADGLVLAIELCGAELHTAFPDDGAGNALPNRAAEI